MGRYHIYSFMYRILNDFSNGAEDQLQIFLLRYLCGIEQVLEKFYQVSQFNTRF